MNLSTTFYLILVRTTYEKSRTNFLNFITEHKTKNEENTKIQNVFMKYKYSKQRQRLSETMEYLKQLPNIFKQ